VGKPEVWLNKREIPIQPDEKLQNTERDAVALVKKNRQRGFMLLHKERACK
jgi:hypothetical protein